MKSIGKFGLRGLLTLAAVSAAVVVAGCSGSSGSANKASDLTTISFRNDVYYLGTALPVLVGIDRGIYKKYGLNVIPHAGKGSATTVQTVANNSDNIGLADAATMILSVAKGLKVKAIGGLIQKSPDDIIFRADSGITKPTDLNGKTGAFSPGSGEERLFPAFAAATGLDVPSIQFLKVNVPTRSNIFLAGKTDFTFGIANVTMPQLEERCGCKLNDFRYADYGVDTVGTSFIVSDAFAKAHPQAVHKFMEATTEAVAFTNAHLDEAVKSFYHIAKSSSVSPALLKKEWRTSVTYAHTKATEGMAFGCMAPADWQRTIEVLQKYGDLKPGVTPAQMATNQYIKGKCPLHFGH